MIKFSPDGMFMGFAMNVSMKSHVLFCSDFWKRSSSNFEDPSMICLSKTHPIWRCWVYVQNCLVVYKPFRKIWKSIGMMKFPLYGNIRKVPNHQPENSLSKSKNDQPILSKSCCIWTTWIPKTMAQRQPTTSHFEGALGTQWIPSAVWTRIIPT